MLTVKKLESLAQADGRYSVGDGSGLMLFVRGEGGRRQWVQRLKIGGKARDIGLGAYPDVSLAAARAAAAKNKAEVVAGNDPLAARREREAAAEAAKAEPTRTFSAALDAFIAAHGAGWKSDRTRATAKTSMERHAAVLLPKPVRDIAVKDVLAVLSPIWATKPVMAQHIRARLESIFDWAKSAGWRSGDNPAAWRGGLKPLLAKPSSLLRNRHHPALPWPVVASFLTALRGEQGNAARCLELCVLTAVRSGEARDAEWREFDLTRAIWTLPAGRTKTTSEHRVPLSPPALALITAMLPPGEKPEPGAAVFPCRAGGPYSDMSILAVVKRMDAKRMAAEGVGWRDEADQRITPHGFRSTFRCWCGDQGHPRDLAEAALAHALGSRTERAYARTDLLARRARLMDAWAAHCEGRAADEAAAPPPARLHAIAAA